MINPSSKITTLLLFAVGLLFAGCANPLMQATEKGDIKEMERFIAAGAEVNARSNFAGDSYVGTMLSLPVRQPVAGVWRFQDVNSVAYLTW